MKKTIRITESELTNIINSIINEQSVIGAPNFGTITMPSKPKNKKQNKKTTKTVNSVIQGVAGDPYQYKQYNGKYYFAKKGDNDKWVEAKNPKSIEAIKKLFSSGNTQNNKKDNVINKAGANIATFAQKMVGDKNVINPNASLLFDGDKLYWMVNGSPTKSWSAHSGLTFYNTPIKDWGTLLKSFVQSPEEFAKTKDAGPIPPGKYVVGPIETRKGSSDEIGMISALWNKLLGRYDNVPTKDTLFQTNSEYSKIGWGNYRAPINSQPGTATYGRGSFYIHGGSFEGSHGCIDLTDGMENFAKYYGTWLSSTKKRKIPMVVDYQSDVENNTFSKLWKSIVS